ncbi:MAG: (Dimethylallyl)adenosine tRNA methylthiotransferase MiaB, partial [candidate division WWE3 bacterium GW2011_GWB1_41_6]
IMLSMEQNLPKKYHIRTYGCQANHADSNTIAGVLEALDFEEMTDPIAENDDDALYKLLSETDLFIVNTCSVRQKSEDKVYGMGKMIKKVKTEKGRKPYMVMAGCMVGSVTGKRQRYAFEELKKKTPWVDYYINPTQILNIPEILHKNGVLSEWAMKKFDPSTATAKQSNPEHAFINISYGCDNFCTFCVVPYARGEEVSRSEEDIILEIRHLVLRGFKEFTLCGQNVNSWGLKTSEKFDVRTGSDQAHEIESVEKINFISSNPFDFTMDLIEAIKLPKISNYLHIAVQSGNNDVLKKMNRRHTIEEFIDLTKKIKKARPNVEFGTDIIVGFPGETEDQFNDTVELFRTVPFNVAFISIYSPRKGTPAERFYPDDIPLPEKKRRHADT